MPLWGKNKSSVDVNLTTQPPEKSLDQVKQCYVDTINSLILYLQQFALNINEINSDRFKSELDEFRHRYFNENSDKQLVKLFNQQAPRIQEFIQHQHTYLEDREKEFRDIIDLLSKAMSGISNDNNSFYRRLNDYSGKLEQITLLDDIKKIKGALETEVTQLRQMVSKQKEREDQQIERLANQVDYLKVELEKTKVENETDALTGINNRKSFDQYLENLIIKSRSSRINFAMMLLDIDDFKQINDNYGHLVGDRVLVAFAQKCRGLIRSNDYIARFGGEEFVIILPGASLRNAKKKAKQICKSLASIKYAIEDGADGNYIRVTTSIGVASLNKKDDMAGIVDRADRALYLAKKEGIMFFITF